MNVWTLTAAQRLERTEAPLPAASEGKIRVRVTKVMIGGADYELCAGLIKGKYPIVPGRFAIGLVSDESGGALFPKNTRVLLHAFCPAPDTGTAKKDFAAEEVEIRGLTCDGYLQDFVLVSPDEMTPLPDSISDSDALIVHHLALAKAAADKLKAMKGSHIAVVGGDRLGILLSLLLIYQQSAPILIDKRPERLEFARKCGIYYTLPADDALIDGVAAITGGRMAEGAAYIINSDGNDTSLPFRVCAIGSSVVLCGINRNPVVFDFERAIKREIAVYGVSNASDYLETAINLIANKAIDLSAMRFCNHDISELEAVLAKYAAGDDYDFSDVTILNLV